MLNLATTAFIMEFAMNEKVVVMANRTIDKENVKILLYFLLYKIPTEEFLPR